MKHLIPFAFTGLLLTFTQAAHGQQRLTGRVVDAATGQPVPYASISVLHTTAGTTSNAEGEFELRNVPLPGRLVVSELGHRRDTVAVAAAATSLLVRLTPAAVELPEVKTGTYTEELIKQAYRELRRTNAHHEYGRAFYRQVTYLAGEATEVQEMVWDAASSNAGTEGAALAQGRFAKVKSLLSFKNFSVYTKAFKILDQADSTTLKGLFSPQVAHYFDLKLLGITSNGPQQLAEIGFASKAGSSNQEKGSVVIDTQTKQVLRLRIDTPGFHIKMNNPLFKLQDEQMHIEWVFQPRPSGAATLEYLKVSYESTLTRTMKSNIPVRVSSFTYFYDGRPTPDASVVYAPAKGGEADLAAIKQTTYDPIFWQNNPVVKRTPLEDEVMKSFEQKGAFGTMLTP
jgi:hypothetical protein